VLGTDSVGLTQMKLVAIVTRDYEKREKTSVLNR
jgi:hypothetical protein